jgi:hypothetical protein
MDQGLFTLFGSLSCINRAVLSPIDPPFDNEMTV